MFIDQEKKIQLKKKIQLQEPIKKFRKKTKLITKKKFKLMNNVTKG